MSDLTEDQTPAISAGDGPQLPAGLRSNPLRDPGDRRLPRVPEPCALVVFGVTGDLARKKLLPAIYDLANRGLLPADFVLLGFARRDWEDGDFESLAKKAAKEHARTGWNEEVWARLSGDIKFVRRLLRRRRGLRHLASTLDELRESHGIKGNAAFYLSIPPSLFPTVLKQMERTKMADNAASGGWRRVVVEKPFGHDLPSARASSTHLVDDGLHRRRRVPDRPLPGQGDRPEPDGAAVRQPAVRAGLERQLRRLGADHHGRGRRHRRPGRASTTPPARPATCCRTTCCSCWR